MLLYVPVHLCGACSALDLGHEGIVQVGPSFIATSSNSASFNDCLCLVEDCAVLGINQYITCLTIHGIYPQGGCTIAQKMYLASHMSIFFIYADFINQIQLQCSQTSHFTPIVPCSTPMSQQHRARPSRVPWISRIHSYERVRANIRLLCNPLHSACTIHM